MFPTLRHLQLDDENHQLWLLDAFAPSPTMARLSLAVFLLLAMAACVSAKEIAHLLNSGGADTSIGTITPPTASGLAGDDGFDVYTSSAAGGPAPPDCLDNTNADNTDPRGIVVVGAGGNFFCGANTGGSLERFWEITVDKVLLNGEPFNLLASLGSMGEFMAGDNDAFQIDLEFRQDTNIILRRRMLFTTILDDDTFEYNMQNAVRQIDDPFQVGGTTVNNVESIFTSPFSVGEPEADFNIIRIYIVGSVGDDRAFTLRDIVLTQQDRDDTATYIRNQARRREREFVTPLRNQELLEQQLGVMQ